MDGKPTTFEFYILPAHRGHAFDLFEALLVARGARLLASNRTRQQGLVARGGILFHDNEPYGDIYMEVAEACRRRGLGAYLVQELKRVAYELGSIPSARCSPDNVPSRRTLQKAGFVPFAHILNGSIPSRVMV